MSTPIAGKLHVANDALTDMVGHAVQECYGIVGMSPQTPEGLAGAFSSNKLRRGIQLENTPNGINVQLYVIMEYGTNISAVSQNLVDRVAFVLKEYARVPVDAIEVHVTDIKVRK